ncbi:phage lysis holin [Escherichia coli]|uniref:Phage lysis holin n=1 Tax=Escherichia coli TaxID=562 RepID=A0A376WS01_ECOLX|nr:phage lysis holin [Escherichia coli]
MVNPSPRVCLSGACCSVVLSRWLPVFVLVQFPDLSLPAVCGIGSMLGIAGYQVIEIAIQRRFKGREKP